MAEIETQGAEMKAHAQTWTGFKAVPAPGNAPALGSKVAVSALPDGSVMLTDIGLGSGIIPALLASRLSVINGLRKVV